MGLTTIGVALKQLWLEPQRACAVLYAGVPEHTAPLNGLDLQSSRSASHSGVGELCYVLCILQLSAHSPSRSRRDVNILCFVWWPTHHGRAGELPRSSHSRWYACM